MNTYLLDDWSTDQKPRNRVRRQYDDERVMSTLAVAAVCYFSVSGGPIGSESIFGAGGPAVGLLTLIVFPFVWCIPTALVTAELSTAFPENGTAILNRSFNLLHPHRSLAGGYTVWVYHAFGPFWAFQEGFWAWLSTAIDNALYPSLAVQCISKCVPTIATSWTPAAIWLAKVLVTCVFAVPNLLGVQLVGQGAMLLSLVVTLPFIVFTVWGFVVGGISHHNWSILTDVRLDPATGNLAVDWSLLLSTVFWNCNGFASVSTFAGEVVNPGTTFPRALALTLIAIVLTYTFPLAAGAMLDAPSWHLWHEGSFNDMAHSLGGGNIMLGFVTVATLASNWGQFSSDMFCASYQLTGMADMGLAPAVFSMRTAPPAHVPYASLALSFMVVVVLTAFDFTAVLVMGNVVSALSQVLLLAAAIQLRLRKPHLPRPYRVPGNAACMAAISVMPVVVLGYLISTTLNNVAAICVVVTTILMGLVYSWAMHLTPLRTTLPATKILS
ncbi:Aste57867_17179 [Aphanomyces stellatus]|uniref:Aste57867_17179 protein n=1 Tax=Aphanomyces stellatus TaxID=120398 RepID=A0A485L8I8_9STRA|nr:hypothetical protein As57867_017120 [Aphanomyces stellatus]VFT93936.1 Aste57867_17179 [Aphanomyces stellatus]